MRSILTALAFLVILMAVIPAVKRSLPPPRRGPDADRDDGGSSGFHHEES